MTWAGQVPCHPVDGYRIVYVEVPKAGCTSVKWMLSHLKGGPPRHEDEVHRWTGYTYAADHGELYRWLDTRWDDYYRFTVVRAPIERFLSHYYSLAPWERGAFGDVNRYILEEFGTDQMRADPHLVPQTQLLGPSPELHLDRIVRLEELHKFPALMLSDLAGMSPRPSISLLEMPHLNRSWEREELSPAAVARLRELYAADHEVLGYA